MINDNGPVKGAANVDLACGLNAQIAQSVADAQPGSTVSFKWVSDIGGNVCTLSFSLLPYYP